VSVEGAPTVARFDIPKQEVYTLSVVSDAKGFTTRRNHLRGELLVMPKDYDALRKYYAQFESKDQESVVLKGVPIAAAAGGN
jgi:predicted negative regulator of RcsB-dependent stress response